MTLAALVLFSGPLLAADPSIPTGTQLVYRGSMTPVKDDGVPIKKTFELSIVVSDKSPGETQEPAAGPALLWTLEETGRGGWLWLDHFGVMPGDPLARDAGQSAPALLYERQDGKSVVPLPPVLFSRTDGIDMGATWTEGRLEYRVAGEKEIAGRKCREIEVKSPFGHKRTLFVDARSPLVVALRETVFIGQGEQHELVFELAESKRLEADALKAAEQAFAAALALRAKLERAARSDNGELADQQLATIRAALPALAKAADKTPLAPVVAAAQKDLQSQRGRSAAAAALREQIVGRAVGKFKLVDLAGKSITEDILKDKITVLHFWTYRDAPLEEPYGQVGYLDFLVRQRAKEPVQVLGVAVDERVADETERRSVAAAARRFRDFMNVGYPIVLDDGELLKRLGDPQPAGGKLPLFVVIGQDGKVVEYHAGLYEVTPQEGLAELDQVVSELLK